MSNADRMRMLLRRVEMVTDLFAESNEQVDSGLGSLLELLTRFAECDWDAGADGYRDGLDNPHAGAK